jgi:hypothetical protein
MRPRPSHVYHDDARMPFPIDAGNGAWLLAHVELLVGDRGWPPPEKLAEALMNVQEDVDNGVLTWDDFDAGCDRLLESAAEEQLRAVGIDPAALRAEAAASRGVAPWVDGNYDDGDYWYPDEPQSDTTTQPPKAQRTPRAPESLRGVAAMLSRRALGIDGHRHRVLAESGACCKLCGTGAAVLCYCLGPFGQRLCGACDRQRHLAASCDRHTLLRLEGCDAAVVYKLHPNTFIAEGAAPAPGGGFPPDVLEQVGA